MRYNDIDMKKVHPPLHPPITNNDENLVFIMKMEMYVY